MYTKSDTSTLGQNQLGKILILLLNHNLPHKKCLHLEFSVDSILATDQKNSHVRGLPTQSSPLTRNPIRNLTILKLTQANHFQYGKRKNGFIKMTHAVGFCGIADIISVEDMKMTNDKSSVGVHLRDTLHKSYIIADKEISTADHANAKPCFTGLTIVGSYNSGLKNEVRTIYCTYEGRYHCNSYTRGASYG